MEAIYHRTGESMLLGVSDIMVCRLWLPRSCYQQQEPDPSLQHVGGKDSGVWSYLARFSLIQTLPASLRHGCTRAQSMAQLAMCMPLA